jgi:hypothetical protein
VHERTDRTQNLRGQEREGSEGKTVMDAETQAAEAHRAALMSAWKCGRAVLSLGDC